MSKKKILSEEHKRKLSEAQKKRYQNPEERKKISEAMKKAHENPEVRKKISNASKKMWQNPDYKEKMIIHVKERWQNSDYKKKTSEAIKKAYENPELREKRSEAVKKRYENPEERKKTSEAIKKAHENPEVRKKISNASKKMWQNPEIKKRLLDVLKSISIDYNIRQKRSNSAKKQWLIQAEQHRQEFIEKYNLSKEFLIEKFVENNRFDIYKFCEYCNISYHTGFRYKRYFSIETPNVQRNCLTQQEIYDFISQHVEADFNNRKVISPLELDIFIPSKNIAIEFDGLLYHSSGYSSLSACNSLEEYPTYHLEKTQACIEKGIQLFHIFENEWRDKKEIWKSVLLNALGKSEKVYARKCEIKKVPSKEAKKFLEKNHLQGACNSKINLGLFYNNTLISLMTFGKPRFNKEYDYELLRFCNALNTSVIGGAGKLLSYFIKNYNPKSILSYANLRWSTGNLYEQLGFTLISQSSPNYFYFNEDFILHSRIEFQKHKLKDKLENFDEKLTESENMYNNGYRKIYDCGNLVYILENIQ